MADGGMWKRLSPCTPKPIFGTPSVRPADKKLPGNRLISSLFNRHRPICRDIAPFSKQTHPCLPDWVNPIRSY